MMNVTIRSTKEGCDSPINEYIITDITELFIRHFVDRSAPFTLSYQVSHSGIKKVLGVHPRFFFRRNF
jgi:hypothetical protein